MTPSVPNSRSLSCIINSNLNWLRFLRTLRTTQGRKFLTFGKQSSFCCEYRLLIVVWFGYEGSIILGRPPISRNMTVWLQPTKDRSDIIVSGKQTKLYSIVMMVLLYWEIFLTRGVRVLYTMSKGFFWVRPYIEMRPVIHSDANRRCAHFQRSPTLHRYLSRLVHVDPTSTVPGPRRRPAITVLKDTVYDVECCTARSDFCIKLT